MKKSNIKSTLRNIIDGFLVFFVFITTTVYALPSNGVTYDNSNSGSTATTVNEALDDLYTKVNDKQTEIDRINGIGDATAGNILQGKTALVKGQTITGSIPSKGATTYTPSTSNQTIASGNYLSGVQTIKGDANLVAGNIAKGKSIFGVAGTYTSDANAAAANILKNKTAYVNGAKVTGSMNNYSSQHIWINGSNGTLATNGTYTYSDGHTTNEMVTFKSNYNGYFDSTTNFIFGKKSDLAPRIASGSNLLGVDGTYTSDANAVAANILKDKTAYVKGSKITGTIPSKGAATYTPGKSNQTIAAGNYLSGAQTIKGDANLVAGNIKKGVSIFGVAGTYAGNSAASILESNGWGPTARASGLAYAYAVKNGSTITISGTFNTINGSDYRLGCSEYYEIDGKGWGTHITFADPPLEITGESGTNKSISCSVKGIKTGIGLISIGYRNVTGSDTSVWHWNYALVVVYP